VTTLVTTAVYTLVVRAVLLVGLSCAALGHDVITTKITFDREIVRIIYARCAICHREGGSAFSITSYNDARPWAKAIQEEVLERRMPPWGAVKGFGDFRDDQALTPEQIELIGDWVEGGAPEGEPKDLPEPPKWTTPAAPRHGAAKLAVSGDYKLRQPIDLAGIRPTKVDPGVSFQMIAELPDGSIQPLLWLQPYKPIFGHPFWLRTPLALPAGTVIRGLPAGAAVDLLPVR
jgi:hypothetical protein